MDVQVDADATEFETERFLKHLGAGHLFDSLSHFGEEGVQALEAATPRHTGESAGGWYYEIIQNRTSYSIIWGNRHTTETSTPIVLLLQHGHGTRNGGYVEGHDFINPALKSIFDRMTEDAWKVVTQQ